MVNNLWDSLCYKNMWNSKSTAWAIVLYGAALIFLGIAGYQASQSKISLIMGCASGLVLLLSGGLVFRHKKAGAYVALGVTALLTVVFSYRYLMTDKVIPAFLAVLSGAMLLFLLARTARFR